VLASHIVQRRVNPLRRDSEGLADAELGFDAGNAIVYIDDFAGKGVELDIQAIEAPFKTIESRVHGVPL